MKLFYSLFVLFLLQFSITSAEPARLLRYPNANSNTIVFVSGGDIFSANINGGIARKLTSSEGREEFPRISPDGKWIAFTAEYDGNYDIYIMPIDGGEPRRLTYSADLPGLKSRERMGPAKIIMQWTADSKSVIYRSREDSWHAQSGKLYKINIDESMPTEFPLPKSGYANLSADGSKLVYNRIFREYRTWKRYSGGQADDVWLYDFNTKQSENLTNNPAQDIIPMFAENKVYYLSDRDKTMNLFSYDLATKATKKITNFTDFDVKFPSATNDFIAFEQAGYIYLLNPKTDEYKIVNIEINDENIWARNELIHLEKFIGGYDVSQDGSFGIFNARGDIFTVPSKEGITYNLTKSSNAHDRNPAISPNGKHIAYISDESGETEIYIMHPDGSGKEQITNDATTYRYSLKWSPNNQYLLCWDKLNQLYYIDVEKKTTHLITKSKQTEIEEFDWSPDSKWVAYTDNINNEQSVVYLYSLASGKSSLVSDEFFNSDSPKFSDDGKYLFFVSKRNFSPKVGEFEWNFSYQDMENIYGYILQKDGANPFSIDEKYLANIPIEISDADDEEDNELVADLEKPVKKKRGKKDKAEEKDNSIKIDLDNLQSRMFELPIPAGNYGNLNVIKDKLYYEYSAEGKPKVLKCYDIKAKEEKEIGNVNNYKFSSDGKKIMYQANGNYYISPIREKLKPEAETKLDLSNLKTVVNRREEWTQIFNETWRQMRDFFYDSNMHGNNWKAIHDQYAQLLPFVRHRADLTYLLGEMIGELNIGHAYVGGGDLPKTVETPIGLLGAKFELDPSGFYKISKIYEGRNWEEKTRSPLTEAGINAKVGDYIIAIDGVPLSKETNPYKALSGKANQFVKLTINSRTSKSGAKDIIVKTIASEGGLLYYNWVENNRNQVEQVILWGLLDSASVGVALTISTWMLPLSSKWWPRAASWNG